MAATKIDKKGKKEFDQKMAKKLPETPAFTMDLSTLCKKPGGHQEVIITNGTEWVMIGPGSTSGEFKGTIVTKCVSDAWKAILRQRGELD